MPYFSNANRSLGLLVGLVVIGGPVAWWSWNRHASEVGPDVLDPGVAAVISLAEITELIDDTHFRIIRGSERFVIVGPTLGLHVGDALTLGVVGDGDGIGVQEWRQAHPYRQQKKVLGLLAALFLLVMGPKSLKWGEQGLEVRAG